MDLGLLDIRISPQKSAHLPNAQLSKLPAQAIVRGMRGTKYENDDAVEPGRVVDRDHRGPVGRDILGSDDFDAIEGPQQDRGKTAARPAWHELDRGRTERRGSPASPSTEISAATSAGVACRFETQRLFDDARSPPVRTTGCSRPAAPILPPLFGRWRRDIGQLGDEHVLAPRRVACCANSWIRGGWLQPNLSAEVYARMDRPHGFLFEPRRAGLNGERYGGDWPDLPSNVGFLAKISNPNMTRMPENARQLVAARMDPRILIGL
jgi:hypothetical protein